MKNLIIIIIVKMWLAFIGVTFADTENVEVFNVDQTAFEEKYEGMEETEFCNYEKYFDDEEETGFGFYGLEFENGDIFYAFGMTNGEYSFMLVTDGNFKVTAYVFDRNVEVNFDEVCEEIDPPCEVGTEED